MAGPFHRPSIVNPDLRQVGFGEYCGEDSAPLARLARAIWSRRSAGGHPLPNAD